MLVTYKTKLEGDNFSKTFLSCSRKQRRIEIFKDELINV